MLIEPEINRILSKTWEPLFDNHKKIENGHLPGVYLLAWSNENLNGQNIKLEEIFYIGMSNDRKGVSNRIGRFVRGVENGKVHSAAKRFFKLVSNGLAFSKANHTKNLYMITSTYECVVQKDKRNANDLRIMGDICRLEYYLLATVKEKLNIEPELNKK